jgi:hypothetical protein
MLNDSRRQTQIEETMNIASLVLIKNIEQIDDQMI